MAWYREPRRHALASKGIKTAMKDKPVASVIPKDNRMVRMDFLVYDDGVLRPLGIWIEQEELDKMTPAQMKEKYNVVVVTSSYFVDPKTKKELSTITKANNKQYLEAIMVWAKNNPDKIEKARNELVDRMTAKGMEVMEALEFLDKTKLLPTNKERKIIGYNDKYVTRKVYEDSQGQEYVKFNNKFWKYPQEVEY